jgi:large subunit ribosomal protein L10
VALNREEKAAVVAEVVEQVSTAQAIIVAEYRGLEVGAITALRKQARESGVYLRVLKNTLARRAIAGTPFEGLTDKLVGPLIYGMSSDPVQCAKVFADFAKSNDKLALKGGAMPNSVLETDAVKALASMPSREALLATLMGTMQAPVATFVRTLNEVPGKFVRTVAALRDEREKAGA